MHVLCVTVLLDPVTGGGTAERTFQLASYFAARGDAVSVLTTAIGLTEARRQAIARAEVVGLRCLFRRFFVVEPRFGLIAGLVKRSDVIHLMGHWNLLNVLVSVLASWYRVPYVICPAGELKVFGRSRFLKRVFNALVGKAVVRRASGWIAVTDAEFPDFRSYGIDPSDIRVLPNGIAVDGLRDAPHTAIIDRLGVVAKQYVLFMGRLNPIKGPDLLLSAFALVAKEYPELHLVFAGPDGGLLNTLKEESVVKELMARVHFAGYVSGADKATLYRGALFLTIPSRHEAMSIVVLEAGAVGVPVLLTDQCGFDQVADIEGGKVVSPDEQSLAQGMRRLLAKRSELDRMGRNLRRLVEENYSWDTIGALHESYFGSLVRVKK
ncbi:MAG: glycosyltransferase family 4 protein [Dechloromonas sp.]|nr:glycosyltransferase family 4 protein [Dechloromonas sp.]